MSDWLKRSEKGTLAAVCRTLIPRLTGEQSGNPAILVGADQVKLADQVEQAIPQITSQLERAQLRLFLKALASPLINGMLSGKWRSFSRLDLADRTEVLHGWMSSRFGLRRAAFQAIKRLTLFLFYSWVPTDGVNPTWSTIGYEPPSEVAASASRAIKTMTWRGQQSLAAEVLVIGSGAGGSVAAAQLAQAGFEVLIVEKGGDESPQAVAGYELEGNAALFERRGGLTTADVGLVVLAGSTLGGGTVVNWSTSLPTPAGVRREWAHDYGFEGADGEAFQSSTEFIQQALHVTMEESPPNRQNQALADGAGAAGHEVKVIPRNVENCVDCTFCMFGCRYGAKQSTRQTFLAQAQAHGARVLVRAQVDRLLIKRGRVTGAQLLVSAGGQQHRVTVNAKAVIVAAGAIHTPALLLRSGLRHSQLGRNLRLHPVTAPVGIFCEPVRSWHGPPQTRVIDDMADLDGRGYGVRFEVAPAHPGLWASALPWMSGQDHKELMAQVAQMANIIVLTRDQGSGRVVLGKEGQPVLHYGLNNHDRRHLKRGMAAALRLMRAAGAHTILSPHTIPHIYREWEGVDFETYLAEVLNKPVGPNRWGLFSAHQMGTCRISGWREQGVVRPDGRSWDVDGLFVTDGSVFPTASGVNPMISIMASAHLLSQRIINQLN